MGCESVSRFLLITGFFTVSSTSGKGIRELYEKIIKVTLQQPYMGEMIPESWLSFERVLMHKRGNESLLDWEDLKADVSGLSDTTAYISGLSDTTAYMTLWVTGGTMVYVSGLIVKRGYNLCKWKN